MKRLVLVRHAKAVPWGYDDDFSRDLTDRGEQDAAKVSQLLGTLGIQPGLIISSPAVRALQTAIIFAENLEYPGKKIKRLHDLYDGMISTELVTMLQNMSDEIDTLFIFGHNPSMQFYASSLCRIFQHEIPTCASTIIDFDIEEWKMLETRTGNLYRMVVPKEL
jgi:phosphohistidine phosphatase